MDGRSGEMYRGVRPVKREPEDRGLDLSVENASCLRTQPPPMGDPGAAY
jgi:hypothetical protein